jgi:SAM-dependent methyltransferase
LTDLQLNDLSLTQWYQEALGQEFAAIELAWLEKCWPMLPGQYWLQLGNLPFLDKVQSNRLARRIILSPHITEKKISGVESNYSALPFSDESLDIVFLPHLFEFESQINSILDEAFRVLSPRGHLVFLGFNPWSLWGLRRLLSKRSGEAPWIGQFYSTEKLRRLLINRNAEIIYSKNFFFRPPINSLKFLNHSRWMEKILQFVFPTNAGGYLLAAKKNVIPLTSLKTGWGWQSVLQNSKELAPSARTSQ